MHAGARARLMQGERLAPDKLLSSRARFDHAALFAAARVEALPSLPGPCAYDMASYVLEHAFGFVRPIWL